MRIVKGDFTDSRILDLLQTHVTTARAETVVGSAHALDLSGLQSPEIEFWALWDGEDLLGVGALKELSPDHGEVKSMHVAQARRRTGAGSELLRHIMEAARCKGMSRLSLETGSRVYFRPAREMYRRHGFVECAPFAEHKPDPNNVFMTLDLERVHSGIERIER